MRNCCLCGLRFEEGNIRYCVHIAYTKIDPICIYCKPSFIEKNCQYITKLSNYDGSD